MLLIRLNAWALHPGARVLGFCAAITGKVPHFSLLKRGESTLRGLGCQDNETYGGGCLWQPEDAPRAGPLHIPQQTGALCRTLFAQEEREHWRETHSCPLNSAA